MHPEKSWKVMEFKLSHGKVMEYKRLGSVCFHTVVLFSNKNFEVH